MKKIKPSSRKIKDLMGQECWNVSYIDEKGKVYECQHPNLNIAIRSWYNMYAITLGIKTQGG